MATRIDLRKNKGAFTAEKAVECSSFYISLGFTNPPVGFNRTRMCLIDIPALNVYVITDNLCVIESIKEQKFDAAVQHTVSLLMGHFAWSTDEVYKWVEDIKKESVSKGKQDKINEINRALEL